MSTLTTFAMSGLPSIGNNRGEAEQFFMKIYIDTFYENVVKTLQFYFKLNREGDT
jgi:hypothetical protein